MHKKFDNQAIEQKWQTKWHADGLYDVNAREVNTDKRYVLVELPYPSGNLHIGHWYAFAVPDIYVRYLRMTGHDVIYPMGFDAFGLPAENAAIKRNINPREWTESNIEYMKQQLSNMGNAFTWNKTASTIDPDYYQWTQWMFTQFFEKGIAYRGTGTVNWCPGCNTVIANEQVLPDGTCERSGDIIERKEMPQWLLKITDYADRLLEDLDELDWPEHIKEAQRQWIGRSQGAKLPFTLSTGDTVEVFTTRPDTLCGATYMVLAPEHELVATHHDQIDNWSEVESYITASKAKAEQDRLNDTKEKTGVKLEGITATNSATKEDIPVYIADYVLASYGTGAIMAVPAHDERDHAFAKKFNLPIKPVIRNIFGEPLPNPVPRVAAGAIVHDPESNRYLVSYSKEFKKHTPWFGGVEEGEDYAAAAIRETLEESGYHTRFVRYIGDEVESHFYHPGKDINRALVSRMCLLELTDQTPESVPEEELRKQEPVWLTKDELIANLTDERDAYDVQMLFNPTPYTGSGTVCNSGVFDGLDSESAKVAITEAVGGELTNTYRLRDWSVGRQRYWGVPIPIVYDPDGTAHPIPKEHLPWVLPEDVDFTPTGEPPLAKSTELKARTEQTFGAGWTPEVETLDTFVDSSWYFLRYIDPENQTAPASKEQQRNWMPIDVYFGGAEHTTMHLLYSRFWQKVLYDLDIALDEEPYHRRINRGLILGPDGNKMSKSKGNVIDPDEQVRLVGADTVKMYLAFMGPYEGANYPWDMGGIAGLRRFLERVNGLSEHITDTEAEAVTKQLHKTIKKVSEDVPEYKFNTAISALMMFVNLAEKEGLSQSTYEQFLQTMAPFAPHLTEELWSAAGHIKSIHATAFPEYNEDMVTDEMVTIGVQINGKVRGEITVAPDASQEVAMSAVTANTSLATKLDSGSITKVIYKPGRILNIILN